MAILGAGAAFEFDVLQPAVLHGAGRLFRSPEYVVMRPTMDGPTSDAGWDQPTTSARWMRVRDILHQALQLPAEQRASYLDDACAGDAGLRSEVESLIEASSGSAILDHPILHSGEASRQTGESSPDALTPGQRIAHYEIIGRIGEGGMGAVYKAMDLRLGRALALKVISRSLIGESERKRFAREAKAASALNHPNIVTVYDYDSEQGIDFIAMELVEGVTLGRLLKQRNMVAPDSLLDYVRQIASALAKAHAAGIVHRDLKPGNIMVTEEGLVKILDFGLAKRESGAPGDEDAPTMTLTMAGTVLGTPAYMSPEQVMGETVDARSDIFSFGIILYEILYGRPPFSGESSHATMRQILHKEPEFPETPLIPAPAGMVMLAKGCLQKDREHRLASMSQALDILSGRSVEFQPTLTVAPAIPVDMPESLVRRRPRSTLLVWGIGATALLLMGSLTIPSLRERVLPRSAVVLPKSSQDWVAQGKAFLARYDKKGFREKAIEAFQKAAESDPENASAYVGLADAYLSRVTNSNADQQYGRLAMDAAKQAINTNPYLSAAHASLGLSLATLGQHVEAGKSLDYALTMDPKNGTAHLYRAMAYEKQQDLPNAERSYRTAVSLNANDWRVHNRLGTFLYRAGRSQEAAGAFETADRLAADNSGVNANLGAAYHALGREDDAARAFQKSLSITPTARGFSNLGTLLFYMGRYRESADAFAKSVEIDAQSYVRWGNLGDAYRWTPGKKNESEEAYRRAIQLARAQLRKTPEDADLISSLAVYLARSGRREESLQLAGRLSAAARKSAPVFFKLAIVYEVSQQRAKALEALRGAFAGGHPRREIENEPEFIALRRDAGYYRIATRSGEQPSK